MQSMIRFSLFGNYERFNTNNLETYMKLIEFFGKKGYKPATANELQLQTNGQARVLIMPTFFNESNISVEIMSNRINLQKIINRAVAIGKLNEEFAGDFFDMLNTFIADMKVISNRVALNCDIVEDNIRSEMPTQSSYFDSIEKTEMSVRNAARKEVEKEESNIIFEKYITAQGGFTKYSYDINSIEENQTNRFHVEKIKKLYEAYISIAMEIERGLN